jgi:phosphate transport system substrate-binding protein
MIISRNKFKQNKWKIISALTVLTTILIVTVPRVRSQSKSIIKIDGSSTVYPITEAVAEEFQKEKKGTVRVTVGISGTGGGFKKFCSQEDTVRTDINNASRPIKQSEIENCESAGIEFIELPIAYDAITLVVHQNNPINTMKVAEIKKMWEPEAEGKVINWKQINSSWPDAELRLYGPGADSGTFDYFTEEIVGNSGASRADYTPSEDDNVLVQGVASDPNAIGYFGFAYYQVNKDKLKGIAIDSGDGGVLPSLETVRNGTYKPLSRPIFIYINIKSVARPEVKEFIEYYLMNAEKLVKEVQYVPLLSREYQQTLEIFSSKSTVIINN